MRAAGRRGVLLTHVLVAAGLTSILLTLALAGIGRARQAARAMQCAVNFHQFALALQCYGNDYRGYLPQEGNSTGNTLQGVWYNELPGYMNMARYGEVYPGTSVGAAGGYANNAVWYCPEKILTKKNSASNKNSFHYTFNAVLNGSGEFQPDLGTLAGLKHINLLHVPRPGAAVAMFESDSNIPCDSPANDTTIARKRHFQSKLHLLFLDGHVELVPGTEAPRPQTGGGNQCNASATMESWNRRPWQTQTGRTLLWGPWP